MVLKLQCAPESWRGRGGWWQRADSRISPLKGLRGTIWGDREETGAYLKTKLILIRLSAFSAVPGGGSDEGWVPLCFTGCPGSF